MAIIEFGASIKVSLKYNHKQKRRKVPARIAKDADYQAVAGLSLPSKMPGYAYGLPAKECKTGTKLRSVKGSTCSKCYAFGRGNYRFANVVEVQYKRLAKLQADTVTWRESMVAIIPKVTDMSDPVFRWHDSGDLQSVEHLEAIVEIAERLPEIRFWIPTREYGMVIPWLKAGNTIPANLALRMSAPMIGRAAEVSPELRARGLQTSSVGAKVGFECQAATRNHECGPCRKCWDKDNLNTDYPLQLR